MPRWLEVALAGSLIIVLGPVWIGIALLVLLLNGWPIFFTQRRVGKGGHPFVLIKFRTMRVSERGELVTVSGDRRITRLGALLRKTKLDELPQLYNVLIGDMSFVGPRPEVEEFVKLYTPEQRKALSGRPGITDPASLAYRDESEILAQAENWKDAYIHRVLPDKLRISIEYLEKRTVWSDFCVIFQTVLTLIAR